MRVTASPPGYLWHGRAGTSGAWATAKAACRTGGSACREAEFRGRAGGARAQRACADGDAVAHVGALGATEGGASGDDAPLLLLVLLQPVALPQPLEAVVVHQEA
jgi:hypothetical protein